MSERLDSFVTGSSTLLQLFRAGVDAVGGREATARELQKFDLSGSVHLVALGKAADAMATGALDVLGDRLVSGLVITKHDHLSHDIARDSRLQCMESGHPVPDESSLQAGAALRHYVSQIPAEHWLVFLVSGGTSALVEDLVEGIDLEALKKQTDSLLASGAAIGDMNRHRRTLSRLKGGKLAQYVNCHVLQLLISDVPGDRPGDIGSGLLIPDEATGMPDNLPVWQRIDTHIIASSAIAQAAVAVAAEKIGLSVVQPCGDLNGDMQDVLDRLARILEKPGLKPGLYIWGGEPTIVLPPEPGRGGRNQHLALSLARTIATSDARPELSISILVCGTDGTDGPTVDAGGLVNRTTCQAALAAGLDVEDYLRRADAGHCLEQLGALVTTGPTGTNVMDLAIALVE